MTQPIEVKIARNQARKDLNKYLRGRPPKIEGNIATFSDNSKYLWDGVCLRKIYMKEKSNESKTDNC